MDDAMSDLPVVNPVRELQAALASGALTVAGEKAALIADVEQALTNWQAAQSALEEL